MFQLSGERNPRGIYPTERENHLGSGERQLFNFLRIPVILVQCVGAYSLQGRYSMDTRTIILVGLGFLGGVCIVSAIAYVIGKFRSLKEEFNSKEHQLYEELARRDKELETVARDIREEINSDLRDTSTNAEILRRDLQSAIEDTNRESHKRDDDNERLMCERINHLASELDSRMDKHMAKHHVTVKE